jgi:small subunit ribosomal protein S2
MTAEEMTLTEAETQQTENPAPLNLRTLFVAGVHFGHPTKRWNPKMEEYIFGKRTGAHIIDLAKTIDCLEKAKVFIEELVGNGGECLMVGTKGQAQATIIELSKKCGSMYVNQRWLGGMLTNFQTIQLRIERLIYLEDSFAKGVVVSQTKRESLKINNEIERLNKFFGGIKEMQKLPDVLFVVDTESEKIAIAEANRVGIPIVAIVDTNSDPSNIDYVIPANDDSIRSIAIITSHIAEAISRGKEISTQKKKDMLASNADLEAQEQAARAAVQAAASERSETDAPKSDSPKADAPKADAPKSDSPKADAPKADSPKADAPKSDSPKADAPKSDSPKADAPKAQTSKPKAKEPKAKVKESNVQTDVSTRVTAEGEGSKPQTRSSSNPPKKPEINAESSVQKKSKD